MRAENFACVFWIVGLTGTRERYVVTYSVQHVMVISVYLGEYQLIDSHYPNWVDMINQNII